MRATAIAGAALVLFAAPAWAGYSELKRELEAYEPPVFARPSKPTPPQTLSPTSDFEGQLARLHEAQARWEKSLTTPDPGLEFFTPDPKRLETLRRAAGDLGYVRDMLGDNFTLADLEILALLRNPGVAAKERELRAVLSQYGQVENLDSILRKYASLTASVMTAVGGVEDPDSVPLKFPFPGVLALKGEVVGQEAAAAREALEIAKRDAVTAARKAYWEIRYLQRAGEITDQMLDLMGNLKSTAGDRYAAGMAGYQDVVRAGIEREKTREELATLSAELRNMHSEVVEILDLLPTGHLGAAGPWEPQRDLPDLKDLYPIAKERRQELRTMRAMVGKMERMIEMAETMVYPGFSLNLSLPERNEISRVGASSGGGMGGKGGDAGSFPTTTTASMGEGLPKMPWFGKDDAYLRETRSRLDALEKDLQMEEASTQRTVHETWFRLDKALREEGLYRDRVVPLAQTALEAAMHGYSNGKAMFSDVIESYSGWFQASLGAERAKAEIGIARANLEAAVGSSALGR